MALFRSSCGVYLQSRRVCSRARRLLGGGSDAGTGMRIWKQAIVSLVLLSAAATVWARYFPGAAELLERAGITTASVEPARAERSAGGRVRAGGAGGPRRGGDRGADQRCRLGDRRRAGGAVGVGDALRGRPGGGDRGGRGRLRARGGAAGAARCRERGDRARPRPADARGRRGDACPRPDAGTLAGGERAAAAHGAAGAGPGGAGAARRGAGAGAAGDPGADRRMGRHPRGRHRRPGDERDRGGDARRPVAHPGGFPRAGALRRAGEAGGAGLGAAACPAGARAGRRGGDGRQPDQRRHPHAPGAREPRQCRRPAARRHGLLDHHALSGRRLRGSRSAGDPVERRRRLCLGGRGRRGEAGAGPHRPAQQRRGAGGRRPRARDGGGDARGADAAAGRARSASRATRRRPRAGGRRARGAASPT